LIGLAKIAKTLSWRLRLAIDIIEATEKFATSHEAATLGLLETSAEESA
jgi:hypothetical protein